jgi:lipopolysaccharide export system protein LptA
MIRHVIAATLLICAVLLPASAQAAESLPTNITADTMMLEHAKQTAVFKGHVVLLRKDFRLYADRLVVHYDPKNNAQLRKAEAYGHVKIDQGQTNGTSDEARYDRKQGNIILIGNAVLREPGRTVRGERIVHDLRRHDTQVENQGGGRVHLHLDGNDKASAKHGKLPAPSVKASSGHDEVPTPADKAPAADGKP